MKRSVSARTASAAALPRVPGDPDWVFDRCGSHLALDFANTVSGRSKPHPIERLWSFEQIVRFAEQTGICKPAVAGRLRAAAAAKPRPALAAARAAVALRDALYGIISALAEGRGPSDEDLDVLGAWHARLRLRSDLAWHWVDGDDAFEAVLVPVVRAAIDLVASGPRERLKLCDLDTCFWVFLDTSKNGTRRWCDMKQCGNVAKARRFQARLRD